jgi:crossover junction endodeoxyribonuclease RusA
MAAAGGTTAGTNIRAVPSTNTGNTTCGVILNIRPISVNAMYRSVGRRVILSARGREFKKAAADAIQAAPNITLISGAVAVSIHFAFADARRRDVDNFAKAILDSLKGIMFNDDSDITELHMYKQLRAPTNQIRIVVTSSGN